MTPNDSVQVRRNYTPEERAQWDAERGSRATAVRYNGQLKAGKNHPTTSEIDYAADELAFMQAIQQFQLATGRKFPTWKDVLGVVKALGYKLED